MFARSLLAVFGRNFNKNAAEKSKCLPLLRSQFSDDYIPLQNLELVFSLALSISLSIYLQAEVLAERARKSELSSYSQSPTTNKLVLNLVICLLVCLFARSLANFLSRRYSICMFRLLSSWSFAIAWQVRTIYPDQFLTIDIRYSTLNDTKLTRSMKVRDYSEGYIFATFSSQVVG